MRYWLMKSEPSVFSIDDLMNKPSQTEPWEGVRNYQARNFMREMRCEDIAFFYHSNCKDAGIVGVMKIIHEAYVDDSAQDPNSPYFDPKSTPDNPRWWRVDVGFVEKFSRVITLHELKEKVELADFQLVQRGNRLSILPVTPYQWEVIIALLGR
ncbi:MAG TPA: EVE domain-containing protein [Methylococcaceae bacterium]|nr:EVE domain-containing protein [Methylococcaceae bacterium]